MTQSETNTGSFLPSLGKHSLRLALFVLPIAAIANIALLLWSLDGRSLLSVAVAPQWLLIALIFSFLPWVTNSLRLLIWSRFFALDLTFRQILRIILGTVLGNAVTPTATGAPAVKWALLVHEGTSPDKATTLIGIQTAEDSFASLSLLACAVAAAVMLDIPALFPDIDWIGATADIFGNIVSALLAIVIMAGIVVFCAWAGLLGRPAKNLCGRILTRLGRLFANAVADWKLAFQTGRKHLLASTALATVQWTARHSIAGLVIGFVGAQMMPMLHWALQWLTLTASSIVPTPGGAGGTEASFLLFFAPFLSSDLLSPTMVVWRATIFYVPVILAALIFLMLGWHRSAQSTRS